MDDPVPRRGKTILIVEDSDEVREGLAQLLELNGFTVLDVRDGEKAWACLGARPNEFALILLDLLLPGRMSGRDLRRRQLEHATLSPIPTIVLTCADVPLEDRAPLRPDGWLDKPYPVEQLLSLVRRYVA